MKITLNLASPPSFRDRYALKLAVPALLAGLVVVAVLGRSAAKNYREQGNLARDLSRLQVRRLELADRERDLQDMLRQPGAQRTLREAEFVNTLIDEKRLSLADITLKVAALLPPEVRLSNLTILRSGNDSDLRFQVAGKSEEALEGFLQNLRDSADFADPTVTTLGYEQQGAGAGEVTIVCQTRYLGLDGFEKDTTRAGK
jgi:Tfp pilus assembly protein PilN